MSAVYDLFGNAKTALKAQRQQVHAAVGRRLGQALRPVHGATDVRNWRDLNGDDIAQDNEIGASGNSNFGVSTGRTPDPDLRREYNLEETVGVQHQLLPRVSVFAGYFHRHFYNQEAQQNPLLTSADWTPFTVANPLGNGEMITLFNLDPAKAGQYASQLVDVNSDINRSIYDGFEVSFTARLPKRAVLFGGWSNDRLITVTCDQYDPNKLRFCDQTGKTFQEYGKTEMPPFRNDFKLSGSYPLVGHRSQRRLHELRRQGQQLHRTGSVARRVLVGARIIVPQQSADAHRYLRTDSAGRRRTDAGAGRQPDFAEHQVPGSLESAGPQHQEDLPRRKEGVPGAVRGVQRDNGNVVLQEVQTFGPTLGQPQNFLQARMMRLALLVNF